MSADRETRRILVGITGCTSIIHGIRLLHALGELGVESHVILSNSAKQTITLETDYKIPDVEALGTHSYPFNDTTAPPASGGLKTEGMVIIPCSMKTLSAVANGYGDNLITRAAEVTLNERRRLVIVPRETPLTIIDIENLLRVARAGATVLPPMPAFYNRPQTVDDLVNHVVGKVLDMFDFKHELYRPWEGLVI